MAIKEKVPTSVDLPLSNESRRISRMPRKKLRRRLHSMADLSEVYGDVCSQQ
jgi:hypothetical protein